MKLIIFVIILFFTWNAYAEIERQGNGIFLDHWEEKNVELPDNLKKLPVTPQDELNITNNDLMNSPNETNPF